MSNAKKAMMAAPTSSKVVPARSKIAVNKSVMSLSKQQTVNLNKKKTTGDEERLDEVFAENLEMAIALLPTVPFMCMYKYAWNLKKKMSRSEKCLSMFYCTFFPRLIVRPKMDFEIAGTDIAQAEKKFSSLIFGIPNAKHENIRSV